MVILFLLLLANVARYLVSHIVATSCVHTLTRPGTNVFPPTEKPYYRKGMYISAAFCLNVFVLSIILSCWLIYENKKMDREGVPEVEEFEDTSAEGGRRQEKHRYIW